MTITDLHVLLVEDSAGDARLIQELFAEVRHVTVHVEWVSRLKAGIDRVVTDAPDVVLLDLSLPDSTGLATVARMHEAAPGIPIVVFTSVADETLGMQAVALGAQDYLVKGARDAAGLVRTLRYAIERERLESANRGKDEFLAVLSHELRTPLTAMLGWVRMLQTGRLSPPQVKQALESIDRNTRLQAALINDLLDMSRIIAGKLRLDRQAVDLAAVTAAAVESVQSDVAQREVRIDCDVRLPGLLVMGDAVRLQQVVANLVGNAVKFSSESGHVAVTLDRDGDAVRLSVTDNGQGIAPEVLPYVFELFQQADNSTTRRYGGLGLGLAIVRHVVVRHGGTVVAESGGQGRGATFTVRLPSLDASTSQPGAIVERPDRADATAVRLDGAWVLVVDDHADTRQFVEAVLQHAGASVRLAASVPEALAMLTSGIFDVVLSDLRMPGLDGFDLIARVRALEREQARSRISAIALTARASRDDRQRVLAAGFDYHAAKPIDPSELAALVARAFADRHGREDVGRTIHGGSTDSPWTLIFDRRVALTACRSRAGQSAFLATCIEARAEAHRTRLKSAEVRYSSRLVLGTTPS